MQTRTKTNLPYFQTLFNELPKKPYLLFFSSASVVAIVFVPFSFFDSTSMLRNFFIFQGVGSATMAGFYLSGMQRWTNEDTDLSIYVKILWLLWFGALLSASFSIKVAFITIALFWWGLSATCIWLAIKHSDNRHNLFLFMLVIIALLTTWFGFGCCLDEKYVLAMVHVYVITYLVIFFRIGALMGKQALAHRPQSQFVPNIIYRNVSVWLFSILLLVSFVNPEPAILGWLCLAISGVVIGRLREWHFIVLLKQHTIRWLYLMTLLIGIGYTWRGLSLIGVTPFSDTDITLRVIIDVGFWLPTYMLITFASLRHSGQTLRYSRPIHLGMCCFIGLVIVHMVWNDNASIFISSTLIITGFATCFYAFK